MSSDLEPDRERLAEKLPLSAAALELGQPEATLRRYLTFGLWDFQASTHIRMEWQDIGVYLPLFSLYEAHNLERRALSTVRRRSDRMTDALSDISNLYWEDTAPRPMEQMQKGASSLRRLADKYGADTPVSSIPEMERIRLPRVPELHGALDRLNETLTKRDARGRISEISKLTLAHTLEALTEAMTLRMGKGRKPLIDMPGLSKQLSADFQWLTGRPKKVHRNSAVLPLREFKVACLRSFGIPASENLVRGREQRRSKRT